MNVGPAPHNGAGCEAARTTNRPVRSTMRRTLPNHRSFPALRRLLDHLRCNHIDRNFPRAPLAYKVAKDDVASEKAKAVCGGQPKPTVLPHAGACTARVSLIINVQLLGQVAPGAVAVFEFGDVLFSVRTTQHCSYSVAELGSCSEHVPKPSWTWPCRESSRFRDSNFFSH